MSFESQNAAAFLRLVAAINAVDIEADAANAAVAVADGKAVAADAKAVAAQNDIGAKANLTTATKASLVAAINELKAAIDAFPAGVTINDAATSAGSTWSSSKINTQIAGAVAALINGASGDSDTLKELADKIGALAQADTGLVSVAGAQTFNTAQQLQACTNIGVGNPERNYTAEIVAGLRAGL